MTFVHLALLVPILGALVISGLTHRLAWAYFRSGEPEEDGPDAEKPVEDVSVIIPLSEAGPATKQNIESVLHQDGIEGYEVIVAVDRPDAPAADFIRELTDSFDRLRLAVREQEPPGSNGKVQNLLAGLSAARHDTLVFVDADVRLGPRRVCRAVRCLAAESAGLVCAAQVGGASPDLPSALKNIFVNDSALTYAAQAEQDQLPGAIGAFMVTRRAVLDEVGGLSAFVNQIVMDVPLGQALLASGMDLHLLRRPVRVVGGPETWQSVRRRLHRWFVTLRQHFSLFPLAVVGLSLPLTWTLVFLGIALARGAFVGLGGALVMIVWGWKMGSQALINERLTGDRGLRSRLWLQMGAELWWLGVFVRSLTTNRVWWAGRQLEVHPDGKARVLDAPDP